MRSDREAILARYDFPLDRFQIQAIDALDDGENVVVAAPTGSGKTVVAEYAIGAALSSGRRAFYTAPIKALSNQKYRDLIDIHGEDRVGLLTGDNSINGDAPVVVMTTEVLRNMIYAQRDLSDLDVVVLDEVHFLQDTYRGPVWEEVIIHLPAHVRLVCLSATVSNANELAEWIETVRGATGVVLEERRPVQLDNFYYVGDITNDRLRLLPTIVDGRPNPDALRLDASAVRFRRGRRDDRAPRGSGQRKLTTPGRVETVEELAERGLLPAIYFIFSRAQCEEAARACVAAGLRLTDDEERSRINEIASGRLDGLSAADLEVLGYTAFIGQLVAGFAPHHAGMVPPFKEVVEACFNEGLVKVVFATETLAVGVNMPARSVVIEKLTKFTGDRHETLSAGQYTQLTGRAGRRGIDEHGAAVVLWSPFVTFEQVAELALSKSFHLRSAFRPTFNMAANLVRTYDATTARQLLTLSFAQFQADRDVVRLERRLQRQRERLLELIDEATSPYGDLEEYRRAVADARGPRGRDDPIELAMLRLRPGAVIHASKGKHHGPVAVVATAHRKGGFRLTTITSAGHALQLDGADFVVPPEQLGTVVLPGVYSPNRNDYRAEVGRRVRDAKLAPRTRNRADGMVAEPRPGSGMHPVEHDPDLKHRLRAAGQADRVRREIADLESRVLHRNATLAQEFDGVLSVLSERGLLDIRRWKLTEGGEMLARVFHENDLLVTEAMRAGLLDDVDAPTLAGLVSTFVYEHRSPDDPPAPWFPSRDVRERYMHIEQMSIDLAFLEQQHGLAVHRPPEPSFFAVAYAWVAGESFAEVVAEEELTGGDFVRAVKQLTDLLGQLATVSPNPATRHRPPCRRCLLQGSGRRRFVGPRQPSGRRRTVTVGKGQAWGVPAAPPADLRTAGGDAELAALVSHDPGGSYAVRAGDLHRSIGAPAARRELHRLPIDAMRVSIDGTHVLAVSHVIARNRWWSGPIVAVTNCGYIGAWNVAPRAHPNDGRFDIVEVSPSMSPRQRWQARGRLRHGTHVPHPDLSTRTAAVAEWEFDGPLMVQVDGVRQGRCTRLGVTILPDHFAIYA